MTDCNPNNYTTLTFDCYGTLIDWQQGILDYLQPLFERHDVHVINDFVLEFFAEHEPIVQAAGGTYKSVLAQVLERFAARLGFTASLTDLSGFANSIESWPPFPDTVPALTTLADHFELGIVSNIDDDLFAASQKHLAVTFHHVVTAEQVGAYKPDSAMFEAAAKVMKPPVLHVAQSRYHDIVPASARGLDTVWINRAGTGAAKAADADPTWEFPDLATFVRHLGL